MLFRAFMEVVASPALFDLAAYAGINRRGEACLAPTAELMDVE
jgi:hypothetical protein